MRRRLETVRSTEVCAVMARVAEPSEFGYWLNQLLASAPDNQIQSWHPSWAPVDVKGLFDTASPEHLASVSKETWLTLLQHESPDVRLAAQVAMTRVPQRTDDGTQPEGVDGQKSAVKSDTGRAR